MKLLGRPFNNEKLIQKQEEIRLEEERARAEKEIILEIQSMELEYKEFILEDKLFWPVGPDDEEVLECEVDLVDLLYSEFNQGSNSRIPYCPISIDTIKKYNDYIYLTLGYENVGYSGLYEEFYFEKKFNYENYEDILDYYDYNNDK